MRKRVSRKMVRELEIKLLRAQENVDYFTYLKLCEALDKEKHYNDQLKELNHKLMEEIKRLRLLIGDISLEEYHNLKSNPQDLLH